MAQQTPKRIRYPCSIYNKSKDKIIVFGSHKNKDIIQFKNNDWETIGQMPIVPWEGQTVCQYENKFIIIGNEDGTKPYCVVFENNNVKTINIDHHHGYSMKSVQLSTYFVV